MDIQQATYSQLRTYRDQIDTRLRQIEQETLEEIERKAREFGFQLSASTQDEPKQKRKRRTKLEIQAANAQAVVE